MESSPTGRNIYTVGGYPVDLHNHRIGDTEVDSKSIALMRVLIEQAPQAVSVAQLLQQVWPNRVVVENVVHKAVARLRRCFGDNSKSPDYIRTVRGVGYQLIAAVEKPDLQQPPATPVLGVCALAVLSPDTALPTLAQGIQQDLLAALYDARDMRVVLTKNDQPATHIDYILNGSLRSSDSGLVLGMQLVDADARLLWATSEHIPVGTTVLPKAQHLARLIQSAIAVARDAARLVFSHPKAPEIWRGYLLERNKILLGAGGSWNLAVEYLTQLTQFEPEFAGSHQHIALSYADRLGLSISVEKAAEKAHKHIKQAFRIAPDSWFTHFVYGKVCHELDLNYVAAEANLYRALDAGAPVGTVYNQLGIAYLKEGLLDAAITTFQEAATSDVASSAPANQIGWGLALVNQGEYAAATKVFERASATAGRTEIALNIRIETAVAYHYAEMHEFAELAMQDVLSMASDRQFLLPPVLALLRPAQGKELLLALERKHKQREFVRSAPMVRGYNALGDLDAAMRWLKQAIVDHDAWVFPAVRLAPHLATLREHSDFSQVIGELDRKETRHPAGKLARR